MFQKKNESAKLPMNYDTYVFDLYGTLVDIHTEEGDRILWEKLALFYGYYDALYDWEELKNAYENKVRGKETIISTDDARVKLLLIPTNEELMIARDTLNIVSKLK